MYRVKDVPKIENIIDELRQLSEDEQRALAGAILDDRKLEAFVEELDDHLSCEGAVEEGSAELFSD
jgi:hypothetical protein